MKTERLLRLAEFLENSVPPDRFDMNTWADDFDFPACDTVACAVGWATTIFSGDGLHLVRWHGWNKYPGLTADGSPCRIADIAFGERVGIDAVAAFFELSLDAAKLVFYTEHYDESTITPRMVSERIRDLVNDHLEMEKDEP